MVSGGTPRRGGLRETERERETMGRPSGSQTEGGIPRIMAEWAINGDDAVSRPGQTRTLYDSLSKVIRRNDLPVHVIFARDDPRDPESLGTLTLTRRTMHHNVAWSWPRADIWPMLSGQTWSHYERVGIEEWRTWRGKPRDPENIEQLKWGFGNYSLYGLTQDREMVIAIRETLRPARMRTPQDPSVTDPGDVTLTHYETWQDYRVSKTPPACEVTFYVLDDPESTKGLPLTERYAAEGMTIRETPRDPDAWRGHVLTPEYRPTMTTPQSIDYSSRRRPFKRVGQKPPSQA